jgi:hypothetical protein
MQEIVFIVSGICAAISVGGIAVILIMVATGDFKSD